MLLLASSSIPCSLNPGGKQERLACSAPRSFSPEAKQACSLTFFWSMDRGSSEIRGELLSTSTVTRSIHSTDVLIKLSVHRQF